MGKNSKKTLALTFAAVVVAGLLVITLVSFSATKSDAHRGALVLGAVILAWVELEIVAAVLHGDR